MARKKTILVLADFIFPEVLGGSARFASELNESLAKYASIRVLTRNNHGLYSGIEKVERCYKVSSFSFSALKSVFFGDKIDLIISHHYLLALISVLQPSSIYKVYFFHGPVAKEELARRGLYATSLVKHFLENIVLSRQNKIFCLSKYMASKVPLKYQSKVVVVGPLNSIVDKEKQVQLVESNLHSKKPINLLCVRRLTPRTGVEELIELVGRLNNLVNLTVVGKGELFDVLASKPYQNVRVLGDVSEEKLTSCYIESDLTILPSRELEGFGLVIVESIMRGTPVLASERAGGGKEFLKKISEDFIYRLDATPNQFFSSVVRCISTFHQGNTSNKLVDELKAYSMDKFAEGMLNDL